MIRRRRRGLAAALVGVLPVLLLVAGAASARGRIVLSADGVSWAPSLTAPLFDPAQRWVPGDVRTASFYVGNRSADPAAVALVARVGDGDALLADDEVQLGVRRGSGTWKTLDADGQPHRLGGGTVPAGGEARIQVRAVFTRTAPNSSQLRRLPMAFEVVLSQAGSDVAGPTAQPADGDHGVLPSAGGPQGWVLLAGLVLIVLGTAVVRIASHRPPREGT